MSSAIFAAVQDFVGEGLDEVLNALAELGVDGVTLAVAYHQARDVTPHSPTRLTIRHDGVHFRPDADLFGADSLPAPRASGQLLVAGDIVQAVRARGLQVNGWGVYCHNTHLGLAHPEVTQRSCYGGHGAPADLCPAQPRVRRYVGDLAVAVARLGVDTVLAESLHYGHFAHGYHHERSFVALGEVEQYLFGLCFCDHCRAATREAGGDPDRAREVAREHLDRVLAGGPVNEAPLSRQWLASVSEDLVALAAARATVVSSLVREVAAEVADAGSRLAFVDLCGAVLGYADGLPTGPLAADTGWLFGIDSAVVASVADYSVLTYASDPARVAADVAAYRSAVGPDTTLRAVLRPGLPDTRDARHLQEKAVAAVEAGADAVDFYHYGLSTRADLARIAAVTRSDGAW